VARNRKRAKERRLRQGQPVASGRGRDRRLENGGERDGNQLEPRLADGGSAMLYEDSPAEGAAAPIGQAAPDAEVAQARLAIASRLEPGAPSGDELGGNGQAIEEEQLAVDEHRQGVPPGPPAPPEASEPSGAPAPAPIPAPRPWLGERLLAFLEGSWRELQRVQWPDRRQVMQATGVVIGFVIVAAVFLGLADFVAPKVVHFVIYGH
jgi:preprotein translocase subunit SecE